MIENSLVRRFPLDNTEVAVSIAREPGVDEVGAPLTEHLAGNILARLCMKFGNEACKTVCQLTGRERSDDKDCAVQNMGEVLNKLDVDAEDVYLGVVTGSANVVFLDDDMAKNASKQNNEGLKSFPATDAVFGFRDTVKACRLADCGMLVVTGQDKFGREFDGFIHATRNNMNGDDQFTDDSGQSVGGVESMLNKVVKHYQPQNIAVKLIAGIRPELYVFDFSPSSKELAENPELNAEQKRESMFRGWFERGWITPDETSQEGWDGKSYQIDMYAAVRAQIQKAGLVEFYDDSNVTIDGDITTGHSSNRAGKHGRVEESRDLYVVIPKSYENDMARAQKIARDEANRVSQEQKTEQEYRSRFNEASVDEGWPF